jgi:predicted DNA-binding transcriptional regulator AlpA
MELRSGEQESATDLRTALLLGKVPEDSGLLINADTVAPLLNVSQRTLSRPLGEKAIPQSVRLGGRTIRWRLAEILEWGESDCPPQKYWTYTKAKGRKRK